MKEAAAGELKEGTVGPFKVYENKQVTPDLPYMRPGTTINPFPMNFTLTQGGMGDYICWLIALQWLTKHAPWIHGRIFGPPYFIQLVRHLFDKIPNWRVYLIEDFAKYAEAGSLIRGATDMHPQLINAVGASLIDIGFAYYANLCPAPPDVHYPELDIDESYLPKQLRGMEKKYAVFTPGGTTLARLVRSRHLNPLIDHAISLGFTPVFLGKHHLADVHRSYFDEDINFSLGIDLREKTSLMEAAAIMKYAAYSFGLDNGLLHLACCTDAPIIMGYNIAHPSQRRPIRRFGKMIEITLTQAELACIHCQTNVKLLCYHNFKNCIYKKADEEECQKLGIPWAPKCIDILFENHGARWKSAIERLLDETATQKPVLAPPPFIPERAA